MKIHVMKFVDPHWVSVGTPGLSDYSARTPSVYVYEGTPYVAYVESRFGQGYVMVKKYAGDGWETVGDTDFPGVSLGEPSIFVDNGIPYVAFTDQFIGGRLTVIKYEKDSWEAVGGFGFTPGSSDHISLYVDNGVPYVAYQDGSSSHRATVAKYSEQGWEPVGSAGFSAELRERLEPGPLDKFGVYIPSLDLFSTNVMCLITFTICLGKTHAAGILFPSRPPRSIGPLRVVVEKVVL